MKRLVLISLLCLFFTLNPLPYSSAQRHDNAINASVTRTATEPVSQDIKPVVYGAKDDGYPDKVVVQGVITQLSFATAYCGWVRHSGTLKIEVVKTSGAYKDKYLYLIVPCLLDPSGESKYLNKKICVTVDKLNHNSLTGAIANIFDSNGIPFYFLRWKSGGKKSFLDQASCGND